ncbi:DEAD/DEAH box helicase [Tessaracoccus oleiagri]|uniref:Superfamily II DNA and RNA helicase n=1 Tax=Tessaracoccus oleiagri TaxID=686624 RepID=A0A1G9JMU7_9ACTN|nr:DEAD/DEAH box helicase [Tessaracoccus oleiagri]SDL38887.1 Superfamily II DNA and RNA helicase [Tessaracoccus oleiagri]
MARAPKSHKADGTPKKRWSPEQRAAKGKGPRRRGGRPEFGRGDEQPRNRAERRAQQFVDRGDDRSAGDRGADRREKPSFNPRWDDRGDRRKSAKPYGKRRYTGDAPGAEVRINDERPRRYGSDAGDRREDRRPYNRDDRGFRDDRGYRDDRRDDRGFRRDDRSDNRRGDRFERRDDRRSFDDRPRFDRDDRGFRGDRSDDRRGDRFDRRSDDRPRFDRDDRGDRRRFDRDDRPRFDRDDRPRSNRDDRPRFDRDDRGGQRRFDRDDRRPSRGPREDRGFDRRDRGASDAPEADQMAWEATSVEGVEGVTNGFTELGVAEAMVGVLAAQGITAPFAIQEATIRDAIAGRDVLGRARTGSGKTLAFGLSLLTRLSEGSGPGPRAVVLSPTRELALQIADNLAPLAAAVKLDLTLIAGGMGYGPQIRAFERGVDVVIATPGRLIDLMEQGAADLSNVEVVVLDEADHMAEMGFTEEVTAILDATPAEGQRLLFSATLDGAVDRIVRKYMHDAVTHEVDSDKASVTTMTHAALITKPHHKIDVTAEIASREGKTVIFARTQRGTDRIAEQLRDAGVMAGALHGGLTQGARARILAAFKSGDVPVLVATDVAARGIHVDDVSLVLQVDPPRDSKDYLHRAGRTARAGTDGTVATIVLPHQRKLMRRILDQAGVKASTVDTEPGSDELTELTGAREASNEPVDERDYQALIAPKQQARKRPQRKFVRRR